MTWGETAEVFSRELASLAARMGLPCSECGRTAESYVLETGVLIETEAAVSWTGPAVALPCGCSIENMIITYKDGPDG